MPYAGDVHVNRPLSNVSVKYAGANQMDLIGDMVFPPVSVAKETDTYYVYDRQYLQIPETIRADGTESNEVNWGISTAAYILKEHSLKEIVTDRARNNQDAPLDLDVDTTENLTSRILLRREKDIADAVLTTTSFSQTHAAGANWTSLTTTTNIVADINTATGHIMRVAGVKPNTMVIPFQSYHNAATEQPNLIEKIKYSERAVIGADLIGSIFDIDKVLVGRSIYDSSTEGIETTTGLTFIWDANTWVGYVAPAPGIRKFSSGYTLQLNLKGIPYKTKKWREEARGGDMIEVSTMYQPRAVATLCGYLITGTD